MKIISPVLGVSCPLTQSVLGVLKIYDIFECVAEYLSIQDIIELLMTNSEYYRIYTLNNPYCKGLLVKKLLLFFSIKVDNKNKPKCAKNLLKIYWYFKRHMETDLADFLIYMIDNDINDKQLFDLFAENCKFLNKESDIDTRSIVSIDEEINDVYIRKRIISLDDMKYILCHGNGDFVDIILDRFIISVRLISHVISKILMKNVVSYKVDNEVLIKFIKHLFIKHCYGSFLDGDGVHIHSIIMMLVKYRRTAVLKYFLDKRKKYCTTKSGLDYQYLINECVKLKDRTHLKMFLNENSFDNSRFVNKTFVIINTHHIIEHCKGSHFDYVCYLVENYLGTAINTSVYIDSICQGIGMLILLKRISNVIDFNRQGLAKYITSENLEKINTSIENVYESENIPLNDRIYV